MSKDSFVLYKSHIKILKTLPNEDRFSIYEAIFDYVTSGIEFQSQNAAVNAIFLMIKNQIDLDSAKYNKICEKRSQSGRAGGVAKASKCQQMIANVGKPWLNDNVNENENVNDNENVNENENVSITDIKRISDKDYLNKKLQIMSQSQKRDEIQAIYRNGGML